MIRYNKKEVIENKKKPKNDFQMADALLKGLFGSTLADKQDSEVKNEIDIPNVPCLTQYGIVERSDFAISSIIPEFVTSDTEDLSPKFDWVLLNDNRLFLPMQIVESRNYHNFYEKHCKGILLHEFKEDVFGLYVEKISKLTGKKKKLEMARSALVQIALSIENGENEIQDQIQELKDFK